MPHLFLDCDGVLAAFDEHVQALFGFLPNEVPDDTLWREVNARDDFWLTIPVKDGAETLWKAATPFAPTILTGCPKSDFDRAAAHKREWIARHFGAVPVITCRSKDKQTHMKAAGDVLVDDRIYIIKNWRKAGGRGILHLHTNRTVGDLLTAMG